MTRNVWGVYVKVRAGFRCEICKRAKRGRGLHAHHINSVSGDNTPANGRCLCNDCHRDEHRRRRIGLNERWDEPGYRQWRAERQAEGRAKAAAQRASMPPEVKKIEPVRIRQLCKCRTPLLDEDSICVKCGRTRINNS